MFQLHDLKESRVWQEAHEEGKKEGKEEGTEAGRMIEKREVVRRMLAKGRSLKEIAEVLGISQAEVRRLSQEEK